MVCRAHLPTGFFASLTVARFSLVTRSMLPKEVKFSSSSSKVRCALGAMIGGYPEREGRMEGGCMNCWSVIMQLIAAIAIAVSPLSPYAYSESRQDSMILALT